jgi:hypothetical protein
MHILSIRKPIQLVMVVLFCCALLGAAPATVEQWDVFEITLQGPSDGNPFLDVELSAQFTQGDKTVTARGFYDGEGTYRVRYMPEQQGQWRYVTKSNRPALDGKSGEFTVKKPTNPNNRGPVRVRNTFHFGYADGTPHVSIGTTVYGLLFQRDQVQEQTLATLKESPFNKVRMLLLPRGRSENEPQMLPFEMTADNRFDFSRFNTKFFQLVDKRVGNLRDMNVEADVIFFHPYGSRDFPWRRMGAENDDRYIRYVVARLAAYRNVWWSMANEYDALRKPETDWDRFFQIVQAEDPSNHLRSIHQINRPYNHNQPWVTHVSEQNGEAVNGFGRAHIFRHLTRKPVCFDEVRYEGDISARWGNMSAEGMTRCFWFATLGGTYCGHSETLTSSPGITWLGQGGKLVGESHKRIAFLRKILESGPREGIDPIDFYYESNVAGRAGRYYLFYFGEDKPTEWLIDIYRQGMGEGAQFHVDVIDTWNMTINRLDKPVTMRRHDNYRFHAEGEFKVPLPGKQWMAIRMTHIPGTGAPVTRPATRPLEQ